jgi:hypothetical protein
MLSASECAASASSALDPLIRPPITLAPAMTTLAPMATKTVLFFSDAMARDVAARWSAQTHPFDLRPQARRSRPCRAPGMVQP